MKEIGLSAAALCLTLLLGACSYDAGSYYGDSEPSTEDGSSDKGGGVNGTEGNGGGQAGVVTAAEWNDLNNWTFWSDLMTSQEYAAKSDYWGFYTNNRVAVEVTLSDGKPAVGAVVELKAPDAQGAESLIWSAVTDNKGAAELWGGLFKKELTDAASLRLYIDGVAQQGSPAVTPWIPTGTNEQATVQLNKYSVSAVKNTITNTADIAFIVDATGSMGDEIAFLQADLVDIIGKVEQQNNATTLRTAALFYRDEFDENANGSDYGTPFSNFASQLAITSDFIAKQSAAGGGDIPEAVHTALSSTLNALSWNAEARTRIAFLILAAPPHYTKDIIDDIHASVTSFAARGIKLIPVAASGVDKNTEFLLRDFAVATSGTYVFLTDDSGVGNSHLTPSVGKYDVELLNALLVRLIDKYIE